MGKIVTFSLDGRSDLRREHPIRIYVRSCDGYRFQSTVGYNIASEKWDPDKQRAIVSEDSDEDSNAKGIPLSEINKRIDAISTAFYALLSEPGAATKSALASVLDRITSAKTEGKAPESMPETDLAVVREFLSKFHDFASKDRRKGFVNVYRPEWHKNQVRFWFNPPFGKKKVSRPIPSGAIMMREDGSILVQGQKLHLRTMDYDNTGKTYELQKCLGHSLSNLVNSIMVYQEEENSFRPEGLPYEGLASSFVIPAGGKRIGQSAFENRTELKAVSIPDSITEIGAYAFSGCRGLEEIHIPDSVSIIEWSAFEGCSGMKSVYLSNVTEIGRSAFEGCVGLREIRIPGSVKTIGYAAFKDCSNLKRISLPKGIDVSEVGLDRNTLIIPYNP